MTRRQWLARIAGVAVAAVVPWHRAPVPQTGVVACNDGISIRVLRQYQCERTRTTRIDVLYGWGTVRPELACRVAA